MGRHSHEHTHEVNNPNSKPVHPDIEHSHDHDDRMNEHHHYSEEPAVVVMGPITPGQWMLAAADQVDRTATECPAYIYVTRGDAEVVVALIGDAVGAGDWKANAKALVSVPALLRFVLHVAAQDDRAASSRWDLQTRAKALIEDINPVEVRSVADRW